MIDGELILLLLIFGILNPQSVLVIFGDWLVIGDILGDGLGDLLFDGLGDGLRDKD
jgi:hypothetical protein